MKRWRLLFISWVSFISSLFYLWSAPNFWLAQLNSYIMGGLAINVLFWKLGIWKWVQKDFAMDKEELKKILHGLRKGDALSAGKK